MLDRLVSPMLMVIKDDSLPDNTQYNRLQFHKEERWISQSYCYKIKAEEYNSRGSRHGVGPLVTVP